MKIFLSNRRSNVIGEQHKPSCFFNDSSNDASSLGQSFSILPLGILWQDHKGSGREGEENAERDLSMTIPGANPNPPAVSRMQPACQSSTGV